MQSYTLLVTGTWDDIALDGLVNHLEAHGGTVVLNTAVINAGQRAVLEFFAAVQSATSLEAAEHLGRKRHSVRVYANELVRLGLLERASAGSIGREQVATLFAITERGRTLVGQVPN